VLEAVGVQSVTVGATLRLTLSGLVYDLTGQRVRLLAEGGSRTGTVIGIDGQGALRLRDAQGREQTVFSGDLSLRPES
jgi:hypothetical protein